MRSLVERYRQPTEVENSFRTAVESWDRILGTVQVNTPDNALDLLVNRWLLYQVTSCRLWGRSAFYQSGGAYGFRDQLQDVAALVDAAPHETRAQILRAASRQFVEGDVQHWWHPPTGRGVRTRCSDDLLWLVYVTAQYVDVTGDVTILDEKVPFLRRRRWSLARRITSAYPKTPARSAHSTNIAVERSFIATRSAATVYRSLGAATGTTA